MRIIYLGGLGEISYLVGCLKDERPTGRTFDIGGPDVLTYKEMMERFGSIRGRSLFILPVPVLPPRLSRRCPPRFRCR